MDNSTCGLDDCDSPRYQNRDLCASHYMKRYRYGDPLYVVPSRVTDLTGRRYGSLVVAAREGRAWRCTCDCGGSASVRTGDLNRGTTTTCGNRAQHWRQQVASNEAAHSRVRTDRGPASSHACVSCHAPAQHWSYNHTDPHERQDTIRGPYSLSSDHYSPRCVPCHKRFDLDHLSTTRG
jgi:hypothetical protein